DRSMARMLMRALRWSGAEVELASTFRSYDGSGDDHRQRCLQALGERLAARLCRRLKARPPELRPALFVCYHLYHKAPDWLGPVVCKQLCIPYVVIEASYAARQAHGPWSLGFEAARGGLDLASRVLSLNPGDEPGLRQYLGSRAHVLRRLAPFTDIEPWCIEAGAARRHPTGVDGPRCCRLVTVAMMREGDKLASYRLLAEALGELLDLDWRLEVVGDGAARDAVLAALSVLPEQRWHWHGRLPQPAIARLLGDCDLFLWPALNEAFGMSLIEAAAVGLPVVAGASPGVAGIVEDGVSGVLCEYASRPAFAAAVRRLIADPATRAGMGVAAARRARDEHSLPVAAERLRAMLAELCAQARSVRSA
ncbi:MAG: glycosyltransferase family 4 protein, partial [Gammaproteobacteria bacterium]|nr:glycosyltransferase family 4 protein [Gammaproteobacteria bacterium]